MPLRSITSAILLAALVTSTTGASDLPSQQKKLFDLAVAGTQCEEIPNNGLRCTYRIGSLQFAIKDVGGTDTIIAFGHSDANEEHYALMYWGCVAIAPGNGYRLKYDHNYGVYISPVTGKVYRSPNECVAASKT
jgi:hypothetical protein